MTSFNAVLSIGTTFSTDLTSFMMDIDQQIDTFGRPASPTFGGILIMSFNTLVNEWMTNPVKQLSGSVLMLGPNKETLKTLDFTNAYYVDLQRSFDATSV